MAAIALALTITAPTAVPALDWGVIGPTIEDVDFEPIFKVMQTRHLTEMRIGVDFRRETRPVVIARMRRNIALAKVYGVNLKPILAFPIQEDELGRAYPSGDRERLYGQTFESVREVVSEFRSELKDWELGNEINLLARDEKGQALFGRGWSAAEFDQPIIENWALVLRAASDAIGAVNREHGVNLRRVLNTTSTMFGFLDHMEAHGVKFEVISYHYYEKSGQNPHRAWNGGNPRYDLFDKLASYHRPVTFNEVNCGEIYMPQYKNVPGNPVDERCYQNLNAMLTYLVAQTQVTIESVLVYELYDEPSKPPPENRFGLMYDVNRPKVPLFILTRFAGGPLSPTEQVELTRRGL